MSTQKKPLLTLTRSATTTITQYLAVTLAGAIAAAGTEAAGFATTNAVSGDDFAVDVLGTTTAVAGGAITAGAALEVGTGGKLVVQDEGARVGYALFAAGVDTPFEILIDKAPAPPAA